MIDTPTRAHVGSPTPISHIPAADREIPQASPDSNSATTIAPPLSRKEKRKQKHNRHDSALSTPQPSDTDSDTPANKPKPKHHTTSIPRSMPATKNALQTAYPLLICSLGNPGSTYANTLHSAGHIVTSYIASRKAYKPFQKGLSGLVARPDTTHMSFGLIQGFRRVEGAPVGVEEDWTMWQSTSLMNVSGRGVGRAYTEWLRSIKSQYGDSGIEGRLVVVHDELESALGKVTIKDGSASARGHNGLKSCQASLGGVKWWRVGVGIGRPESREPDVVARYVLRKATGSEREKLEGSAIGVVKALEEIAAGQR